MKLRNTMLKVSRIAQSEEDWNFPIKNSKSLASTYAIRVKLNNQTAGRKKNDLSNEETKYAVEFLNRHLFRR